MIPSCYECKHYRRGGRFVRSTCAALTEPTNDALQWCAGRDERHPTIVSARGGQCGRDGRLFEPRPAPAVIMFKRIGRGLWFK